MNKTTNKTRKEIRRTQFKVRPSNLAPKLHPTEKLARKMAEMPIARLSRHVKRAARAQRRGEAVLQTMGQTDKFRQPVLQTIRWARVNEFVAGAELKRREDLAARVDVVPVGNGNAVAFIRKP